MSAYMVIERVLETLIAFCWQSFILAHEMKNIWKKRRLVRSCTPTDEETRRTQKYWSDLISHRIPLWWHRLYASYTGHWDERYIHEVLFPCGLSPTAPTA